MGAWGHSLQDNDTALDALNLFKRKLTQTAKSAEDSFILLYEVAQHFEDESLDAVLAVAEALLDRRADLGDTARVYLHLFLRDALRTSTLQRWEDPGARVATLERFIRRLHLERTLDAEGPPISWEQAARRISEEIARIIETDRKNAEGILDDISRNAEAVSLQSTPQELFSFIQMAIGQWELGIVGNRCFDRFLRSAASARWKLPSKQLDQLLEDVSHPAATLLRKSHRVL